MKKNENILNSIKIWGLCFKTLSTKSTLIMFCILWHYCCINEWKKLLHNIRHWHKQYVNQLIKVTTENFSLRTLPTIEALPLRICSMIFFLSWQRFTFDEVKFEPLTIMIKNNSIFQGILVKSFLFFLPWDFFDQINKQLRKNHKKTL